MAEIYSGKHPSLLKTYKIAMGICEEIEALKAIMDDCLKLRPGESVKDGSDGVRQVFVYNCE